MPPSLTTLLRDLQNEEDEDLRYEAAKYLAEHPDPQALTALCKAAEDEDVYVCFWALSALAALADPQSIPVLLKARYRDTDEAETAQRALAAIGPPAVAPLLEIAIDDDEDNFQRRWAIQILENIKDTRAVPPLVKMASDEEEWPEIRYAALAALGKMKQDAAVPCLQALMQDASEPAGLREAAAEALENIDEKRFSAEVSRYRTWIGWARDDNPEKGPLPEF